MLSLKSCFLILFILFDVNAFLTFPSSSRALQRFQRQPSLEVVADSPIEEKREKSNKNRDDDDWIPAKEGGFIPNLKGRVRRTPHILQVSDIQAYKKEVVDVNDRMVAVRCK